MSALPAGGCELDRQGPRAEASSTPSSEASVARGVGPALPTSRPVEVDEAGSGLRARARTFLAMGAVPVRLRGWAPEPSALDRALPRAQQLVEALEATFDLRRDTSAIARLNAKGAMGPNDLDGHLLALLDDALRIAALTDGAFDPTVGPLVSLWRSAARDHRVPDAEALGRARRLVGPGRVHLDARARTVGLDPGTSVDLNAIAEGYMVDRVVDLLRAEGVPRGYVEVGGDLRVYDDTPSPRPFRIGVRRPGRDDLVGTLELSTGALGSSGCYERYVVIEGKRLCHVVDPRTGQPVRDTDGATVLAPTAIAADALATAVLVLGPSWALEQWGESDELGAVIVTRAADGTERTYLTAAMGPDAPGRSGVRPP